jgi:hypothetical protein
MGKFTKKQFCPDLRLSDLSSCTNPLRGDVRFITSGVCNFNASALQILFFTLDLGLLS